MTAARIARADAARLTYRRLKNPTNERLRDYLRERSRITDSGCWEWICPKKPGGYAAVTINGTRHVSHRLAFEVFIGQIPAGLVLDHLCRNTYCINPDHLEPVTQQENILRGIGRSAVNAEKTHCPRGHKYTPENVWINSGRRYCRACRRSLNAEYKRLRKARLQVAKTIVSLAALGLVACAGHTGASSAAELVPFQPQRTAGSSPTPTPSVSAVQESGFTPSATPARVAAPLPSPDSAGTSTIAQQIHQTFGAAGPTAVRIARCESHLNPKARNGSHLGLFQVSEPLHGWRARGVSLFDVATNIRVAHELYAESGWRPWRACA